MKMKTLFPFLLLFSASAVAAPFLTADPQCYDPTGARAECPASYEVSEDDGATWTALGSDNDGVQVWVWQDLATYGVGAYALQVRSVNAWGVSEPVPFAFTSGVPVGPGGLRLVAP
jgi:hypothetical protein